MQTNNSPSVIDLEHFMESFLALRSNHEPRLLPMGLLFGLLLFTLLGPTWPTTPERLEKVLDFCSIFMSILFSRLIVEVAQRGQTQLTFSPITFLCSVHHHLSEQRPQSHGRKTQTLLNKQARGLISGLKTHKSEVTLFLFVPHKWMRITLFS